ncbi:three-Cys-motif partner protein TcmP [Opitutus terrae]|uniref:Three-Cys-motif partner protein TcmP n=1 Tax=Opitutus terrae (strain DSM 11246 / JCM 15787 / PB90-1) TaxID=452637 RepID=B1ZQH1_OPITP|nr:three-Cys-motif partner protein TcmP [Opitutus terrae]ACB75580.1 conserved hypothetical protein [Opitutus terrae PB90-1]
MARYDHHDKPYDEGTRQKLRIYAAFLRAWIQVFLHTQAFPGPLRFFDFFAGPGQDINGVSGSPMILMEELARHYDLIGSSNRGIEILFNDFKEKKARALSDLCAARRYPFVPRIESEDFFKSFEGHREEIGCSPSFVLLDQCGVKFVTKEIFQYLTTRPQTDMLFFFASSSQRRFSDQFANDLQIPTDTPYWEVHRRVADCYRAWAPLNYFVGQYSIKKGGNIYGLVFGSGHWLGMYKFLTTDSGEEANYEIEAPLRQRDFFIETKLTKLEKLEEELEHLIREHVLLSDGAVALHCVTQGVLPTKVAPTVYKRLRAKGVLGHSREQQPRSSDDAIRNPRPLIFLH